MFLTDFPLRLFFLKRFFFNIIFFPPLFVYIRECAPKKRKKQKKAETESLLFGLTGTLRIRNFSKCWTLLLCSIFTLELPFRTSSSPATSKRVPLRDPQLVLQLVPVRGPGTSFSRSPAARPGTSFPARPGPSPAATPALSRHESLSVPA